MFTHEEIWTAIDRLAKAHGYSTSGLAKKSGLDPTTFNKSKRITADGKPRWPSTESLAKILSATEATLMDLISFIENTSIDTKKKAPNLPHYELGAEGLKRLNQNPITSYIQTTSDSYALTLTTAQWSPLYKKGTTLIVEPTRVAETDDILFIETHGGDIFIMSFDQEHENHLALNAVVLNEPDRQIAKTDIARYAKILWASQ